MWSLKMLSFRCVNMIFYHVIPTTNTATWSRVWEATWRDNNVQCPGGAAIFWYQSNFRPAVRCCDCPVQAISRQVALLLLQQHLLSTTATTHQPPQQRSVSWAAFLNTWTMSWSSFVSFEQFCCCRCQTLSNYFRFTIKFSETFNLLYYFHVDVLLTPIFESTLQLSCYV